MNLNEFNDNYLNILLQKISKEKKNVFLLGDFNVDLLKYDKHAGTNEFIDSLSSYMYLPYILYPNRVTGHSQTIINNIFSNYVSKETVSGNLTSQYLIIFLKFYLHRLCSQTILIQNQTYLKEAGQTSIELNLSRITLIKIGVTS